MKKRILECFLLLLILCTALTGCQVNVENPERDTMPAETANTFEAEQPVSTTAEATPTAKTSATPTVEETQTPAATATATKTTTATKKPMPTPTKAPTKKPVQTTAKPTATPIAGGNCTDTITWTLNSNGTLTIRGTGAISDFAKGAGNQPWISYQKSITALVVEDGITRIGDRAFQGCSYMKSAVIGKDVASIGEWAFQNCYALTRVELQPDVRLENGAFRSTPVEWDISAVDSTLYANSSYYSALSRVVLTGNYREDIINIALSQVGYHEGDSEADYAGNNTNGSKDYTEYGRYLGNIGSAWCSEFASWCIRKAGVPAQIIASSHSANISTFTKDTSAAWYTWDQTIYGGGSYTPRKGDLLLWAWDKDSHSIEENLSHTSILLEIGKQKNGNILLKTIDGNADNRVKECKYEVNSTDGSMISRTGRLCYIIAPDYESNKD